MLTAFGTSIETNLWMAAYSKNPASENPGIEAGNPQYAKHQF